MSGKTQPATPTLVCFSIFSAKAWSCEVSGPFSQGQQVEDLRLLADYLDDEVEQEKALWAVEQAKLFVEALKNI